MKLITSFIITVILIIGISKGPVAKDNGQSVKIHKYDHIVIVIEENKSYDQIIGNKAAPYINKVLKNRELT